MAIRNQFNLRLTTLHNLQHYITFYFKKNCIRYLFTIYDICGWLAGKLII